MSTIITKRQFPHYHKYTMDLAGRPLTLEVGKLAELANAAVMVGYGDTRVLCCVTAAPRPRDGIDFFPCPWTSRRRCTPWAVFPAASTAARAVPARRAS